MLICQLNIVIRTLVEIVLALNNNDSRKKVRFVEVRVQQVRKYHQLINLYTATFLSSLTHLLSLTTLLQKFEHSNEHIISQPNPTPEAAHPP